MRKFQSLLEQLILEEIRTYRGPALEKGGTSIAGKVAPGVVWLFSFLDLPKSSTILDYGAGKYGRNAQWLRNMGYRVYSYDKFNGSDVDGWSGVSSQLPKEKFKIGFTSFVLNVVPESDEKKIVIGLENICDRCFHITRSRVIARELKQLLLSKNKNIINFFKKELGVDAIDAQNSSVVTELAVFGFPTSRGFQRIPQLEEYSSYQIVKDTGEWKAYSK